MTEAKTITLYYYGTADAMPADAVRIVSTVQQDLVPPLDLMERFNNYEVEFAPAANDVVAAAVVDAQYFNRPAAPAGGSL